jgi:hypothetical protein
MKVLLVKNLTTQDFSAVVLVEGEPRRFNFVRGTADLIINGEVTPELRGLERAGVQVLVFDLTLFEDKSR